MCSLGWSCWGWTSKMLLAPLLLSLPAKIAGEKRLNWWQSAFFPHNPSGAKDRSDQPSVLAEYGSVDIPCDLNSDKWEPLSRPAHPLSFCPFNTAFCPLAWSSMTWFKWFTGRPKSLPCDFAWAQDLTQLGCWETLWQIFMQMISISKDQVASDVKDLHLRHWEPLF